MTAANRALAEARKALQELERTPVDAVSAEAVLDAWDRVSIGLEDAYGPVSLLNSVHPDGAVRDAADRALIEESVFMTELFQNEQLYERVRRVVPSTNSQKQLQTDLLEAFEDSGVSFFLLYTRESHPAENYGAHTSFEQKLAYARDLQRFEDVRFPILVDHLDGRIHRAYGVWPNALFVIHKYGRLIFRSNMANHRELEQFLCDLLAAEEAAADGRVMHLQYSERVLPHEADQATHRRVYERAGAKAFEDYWAKRPQNRNRWP